MRFHTANLMVNYHFGGEKKIQCCKSNYPKENKMCFFSIQHAYYGTMVDDHFFFFVNHEQQLQIPSLGICCKLSSSLSISLCSTQSRPLCRPPKQDVTPKQRTHNPGGYNLPPKCDIIRLWPITSGPPVPSRRYGCCPTTPLLWPRSV